MFRFLFLFILTVLLSTAGAKTVVIDAGHGGRDVGGRYGKIYEKHLALDTAMRLEYYLKRKGYRTVMTRRDDTFIPLPRRSAIGNRYSKAIFISIHYNYTWKRHVEGIETFYYSAAGHELAKACHYGMHRKVSAADRGVKYGRYSVLRRSKIPAILVEGGFLSHRGECNKCKKGSYRDGLARGIVEGIVAFDRSGLW